MQFARNDEELEALHSHMHRLLQACGSDMEDETAAATVRCVLEDTNKAWADVTAEDVFAWALDEVAVVS